MFQNIRTEVNTHSGSAVRKVYNVIRLYEDDLAAEGHHMSLYIGAYSR